MELKEFFAAVGGNYEDTLSRLPSEKMIKRFLLKFINDPSFENLQKAWKENDVRSAFLAAHTLKGTAATLGITKLSNISSELTEKLRGADALPESSLLEELEAEYRNVISSINEIE